MEFSLSYKLFLQFINYFIDFSHFSNSTTNNCPYSSIYYSSQSIYIFCQDTMQRFTSENRKWSDKLHLPTTLDLCLMLALSFVRVITTNFDLIRGIILYSCLSLISISLRFIYNFNFSYVLAIWTGFR